jgi:hypothetical protein
MWAVMKRRLLVGAIVASTILGAADSAGAAGAPAAKSSTPAKWAAAACSSVTSWVDEFKSGSSQLTSDIATADLTANQSALVAYLDHEIAFTDQTDQKLTGLAPPKVRNGAKIVAAFDQGFQAAKAQFENAKAQAAALPVDDPDAYLDAVEGVTDPIGNAPDSVTSAIESINDLDTSGALLKAFAKQKACKPYVL